MQKKVIHPKNLPAKLPIFQTATVYLLVDKFQIHGVLLGVICTIGVALWLMFIYVIHQEKRTDIL